MKKLSLIMTALSAAGFVSPAMGLEDQAPSPYYPDRPPEWDASVNSSQVPSGAPGDSMQSTPDNNACPPCPCAPPPALGPYPGGYGPFPGYMPAPPFYPPADFFSGFPMPEFSQPLPPPSFHGKSMRLKREATPEAYVLHIYLNGEKPENIQVTINDRALVITNQSTQADTQQHASDHYSGYSFFQTYRQTQERTPVPPDADLANMIRHDSDEEVELRIPRIKN